MSFIELEQWSYGNLIMRPLFQEIESKLKGQSLQDFMNLKVIQEVKDRTTTPYEVMTDENKEFFLKQVSVHTTAYQKGIAATSKYFEVGPRIHQFLLDILRGL